MPNKEQERSKFALNRINELTAEGGSVSEDLANFIVGTPTMILQNGFGQTMAFLLAKCRGQRNPRDKHYFTFNAIARWSRTQNDRMSDEASGFFGTLADLPQNEYLILQEEALKMLQWLKRYARAFQEEEIQHEPS